jgi:polysaccharide biosynthesis transport protein
VAEFTNRPVIGHLPHTRSLRRHPDMLVWHSSKLDDFKEALRALRTNVDLLLHEEPHALLVTSSTAAQGKSMVVANLGVAMAQVGWPTLIVDADIRQPRQHRLLGVDNSIGLTTLLTESRSPLPGLASFGLPLETQFENLRVLPAGPVRAEAYDTLSFRFELVLGELRRHGGLVLVDGPPILSVSYARALAAAAGSALLVVSASRERPTTLRRAIATLEFAEADLLGVILNSLAREVDAGVEGAPEYAYEEAH